MGLLYADDQVITAESEEEAEIWCMEKRDGN